jgi:hypothetical protein
LLFAPERDRFPDCLLDCWLSLFQFKAYHVNVETACFTGLLKIDYFSFSGKKKRISCGQEILSKSQGYLFGWIGIVRSGIDSLISPGFHGKYRCVILFFSFKM